MIVPGIITCPAEAYHADQVWDGTPTLSASIASILCSKSPAHARHAHPRLNPDYERKAESKYDVGTVVHSILLEGADIVYVVHADSWRTKDAKEARDQARAHGRVPLLAHQLADVEAMVAATYEWLAQLNLNPPPFQKGKPEQTLVWDEDGVTCRARVDWLHDDHSICDDFKSTSASSDPAKWSRTAFTIGADVQSAFYRRGLRALTGKDIELRYIVQETYPPYVLSPVSLGPDVIALGDAKVEKAIQLWRSCLASDHWPGYVDRVAYIDLPAWEESRWLEKEAREAA